MSVRSIIDIDLNSDAFQSFKKAFDEHRGDVASLPADWKKTGDAMKAAGAAGTKALKSEAELIAAMAVGLNQVVRSQSELTRVAGNSHGVFKNLLGTTKGILANVTSTTYEFLKWGALGILSVGAAGAYAFGRSTSAGSNLRAQSGALGIRAGQLNAARDVYGPMLGGGTVESILQNIAAAQSDPTKWRALQALGINPQSGQSPGDLLPQVLTALGQKYQQFHGMAPLWDSAGLGNIADLGSGRLLNQRQGELGGSGALYRTTSQALEPGDDTLQGLQNARVSLDIFKTRLENIFLKAFNRLNTPGKDGIRPIDKLEDSIAGSLEAFANNPDIGKDIQKFGEGIKTAAVYLGSDQFKDDVKGVAHTIHMIAHPFEAAKEGWDRINAAAEKQLSGAHASPAGDAAAVAGGVSGAVSRIALRAMTEIAEQKYGLPKGLMWGIAGVESSYGSNVGPSSAGARGIFQDMPGTLKQYGIHLGNTESEVGGNARYLRDLVRLHGGNVEAALKDYGGFVSKDPGDYISSVRANGNMAPASATPRVGVTVTTTQAPGSDTNTTASAMVH